MKERGEGFSRAPFYVAALVLILGLFFHFFLMPLLAKKNVFRGRVAELRNELDAEQELHQKLQRERQLLDQNDPAYLEKYARDNFGWAREGEIVYKLEKPK
ncbi:MAG: septum formation initiator family protein [Candidatus Aureabacteria bacterium]|nr:septum formation initiator family protein [Candidatus Auribacterota bacterium]